MSTPSVSNKVKPVPATLDALPVTALRGVGPRSRAKLEAFGLETVQDVLFH
jgi:nucleotidyltransferase/DNA polymerase involved in DNA repair